MGCTTSKQARRGRRRCNPSPELPRDRRVAGRKSGVVVAGHHVALTSSTLGFGEEKASGDNSELASGVESRAWSEMIEQKIPKSLPPIALPPPEEPPEETINVCELMEGLEEEEEESQFLLEPTLQNAGDDEEEDEPMLSDFDPDLVSDIRTFLRDLSPQQLLHPPENSTPTTNAGTVKEMISVFQAKIDTKRKVAGGSRRWPPGGEGRLVVYFTSLRGVRKTHEDCSMARAILRGYGVRLDERDFSMHRGFKEELGELLGSGNGGRLPRVFADGKYLGGADEVRKMHEDGELAKALVGCQAVAAAPAATSVAGRRGDWWCEECEDARFVPCGHCSGSCKVFVEEEEEGGVVLGVFRRCTECNENGLLRCAVCF